MEPKKKHRLTKIILTLIFIAINVAVIAITAVNEFGDTNNVTELSFIKLDWWMLIPATLCFLGMIFLEFFKYALMIRRLSKTRSFTWREALKLSVQTVMLGRYYDRITPAAVGGQPFQIYHMHKVGKISNGAATTIPIFGMISGQIAFLIIAIPCFILAGFRGDNPVLLTTAWIGLLFYAFWPIAVAISSLFPKTFAKLVTSIVKVLSKLRIVKNQKETVEKVENELNGYVHNVRSVIKKPMLFAIIIAASIIGNILIAFVPYFVLKTFGGNMGFGSCFILTMAITSAVYFIPTPGNSGAAEGTFYVVFSALSSGYVFWAMLFWRLYSYYIYIIVGPLIYLSMYLEKKYGKIKR